MDLGILHGIKRSVDYWTIQQYRILGTRSISNQPGSLHCVHATVVSSDWVLETRVHSSSFSQDFGLGLETLAPRSRVFLKVLTTTLWKECIPVTALESRSSKHLDVRMLTYLLSVDDRCAADGNPTVRHDRRRNSPADSMHGVVRPCSSLAW